jgi:uncharacterized NAD(P)/FAD-binding protein YdhS
MDGGRDFGPPRRHVLVIGGGASGVLLAAQLLRQGPGAVHVTLVERSEFLGCGIAYGTTHPDHLLNTRVAQMSAFPDDPGHLPDWLRRNGLGATAACFIDRGTYGRYLADLLNPTVNPSASEALDCVRGTCVRLDEGRHGVVATLEDGRRLHGDVAVLATGHAVPSAPEPPLRGAWDFTPPASPDATIAIIGTGLSMVDHVVSRLAGGHRGPIVCLSRRGLLPEAHAASRPVALRPEDIPFGAPPSAVLRWLRKLAAAATADGGTWRDALDAVRPHVAAIWRAWGPADRARFLRHAAAQWEVHRHRMPPASAARIRAARESGQLSILRGRFQGARVCGDGRVEISLSRARQPSDRFLADHVVDCRGIRRDPALHATPVVADLLARGAARIDALGLGLDTTVEGTVIDAEGKPSRRILAIGPAARGALWEITAIPDIRTQVAALARDLTAGMATTEPIR